MGTDTALLSQILRDGISILPAGRAIKQQESLRAETLEVLGKIPSVVNLTEATFPPLLRDVFPPLTFPFDDFWLEGHSGEHRWGARLYKRYGYMNGVFIAAPPDDLAAITGMMECPQGPDGSMDVKRIKAGAVIADDDFRHCFHTQRLQILNSLAFLCRKDVELEAAEYEPAIMAGLIDRFGPEASSYRYFIMGLREASPSLS